MPHVDENGFTLYTMLFGYPLDHDNPDHMLIAAYEAGGEKERGHHQTTLAILGAVTKNKHL